MKIIEHLPIFPPIKKPFDRYLEEIGFKIWTLEAFNDGFRKPVIFTEIFNIFETECEIFLNVIMRSDSEIITQSIEVVGTFHKYDTELNIYNR